MRAGSSDGRPYFFFFRVISEQAWVNRGASCVQDGGVSDEASSANASA